MDYGNKRINAVLGFVMEDINEAIEDANGIKSEQSFGKKAGLERALQIVKGYKG